MLNARVCTRLRLAAILTTLAVVAGACQPYTLIVVTVETDLVPGEDFEKFRIEVTGARVVDQPGTAEGALLVRDATAEEYPLSFVLRPGGHTGEVRVTVEALDKNENELVTQSRTVRFAHQETTLLAMRLNARCLYVTQACADSATCDDGECVARDVLLGALPSVEPGRELDGLSEPPPSALRHIQRSCRDYGATQGCELVELEGGTFSMGDANAVDASPAVTVTVDPFALDRYEVTFDRLAAMLGSRARLMEFVIPYPSGETMKTTSTSFFADSGCPSPPVSLGESRPVVCRPWNDAALFCAAEGGRLPTSAEWEFAARHFATPNVNTPRTYPWGEEPPGATPCTHAHYKGCTTAGAVQPVGTLTGVGDLFDLAGNAAEWTSDIYQSRNGSCFARQPLMNPSCLTSDALSLSDPVVIRGGAIVPVGVDTGEPGMEHRALMGASVGHITPLTGHAAVGFRCVYPR